MFQWTFFVFLGYPLGYKSYKVLDLSINVAFIPRDVAFHENIFPFKTTSTLDASLNIFSNGILPFLVFPTTHDFSVPSPPHAKPISTVLPTSTQVWWPHLTYRITIVLLSPLRLFFPLITLCLMFLAITNCHPLISSLLMLFLPFLNLQHIPKLLIFQNYKKLCLCSCKLLRAMVLGRWLSFLPVKMI